MAEITNKVITVPLLQHYKEKEDAANGSKYVGQEPGKGLIETEKVTKLDEIEAKAQVNKVEGIQINGTDLQPDETSKKVNITAKDLAPDLEEYVKDTELTEQLTPYLKSEDASTTYVKEEGFDDKVKGVVGSVYRPKGSKENFEAIKAVETPTEGDVYNATDSGANYVYVGEGQGEDESGWDKLSETVDLSNLVTKEQGKSLVSDTDVAQITTNKNSIDSINEKLSGLQEAEEADIDALFTE